MGNAFEQHARSNGGAVVRPTPPPDQPDDDAGQRNMVAEPAGRVSYDTGNPGQVSSPLFHITVNQDNIGENSRTDASAGGNDQSVDINRYIDRNIDGKTGAMVQNGWTSGINQSWNRHSFRGRAVQFVMRDLENDHGPVGRVNYAGNLAAGVEQQFSVMPSLEDIYRSIASRA